MRRQIGLGVFLLLPWLAACYDTDQALDLSQARQSLATVPQLSQAAYEYEYEATQSRDQGEGAAGQGDQAGQIVVLQITDPRECPDLKLAEATQVQVLARFSAAQPKLQTMLTARAAQADLGTCLQDLGLRPVFDLERGVEDLGAEHVVELRFPAQDTLPVD